MSEPTSSPGSGNAILRLLSAIGPGIFIIGYIIGTGSVTSMAKAGAEYGMTLAWALALSCFCTYVLIVAVSRVTIVSGHTLIRCIRQQFGSFLAILIIVGLMATVLSSVIGVMGIATDVAQVWSSEAIGGAGLSPIITAVVLNGVLCFLIWRGSHSFFLRDGRDCGIDGYQFRRHHVPGHTGSRRVDSKSQACLAGPVQGASGVSRHGRDDDGLGLCCDAKLFGGRKGMGPERFEVGEPRCHRSRFA